MSSENSNRAVHEKSRHGISIEHVRRFLAKSLINCEIKQTLLEPEKEN